MSYPLLRYNTCAFPLQVLQASLAAGDEESVVDICMLLLDMVEHPAPLLQPVLPKVLELCMQIASNRDLELSTREIALDMVAWVARYKPKQLARQKPLLKYIIEALCVLYCEPKPEGLDEEEDPPCELAGQAMEALALNISSQHVFPQVRHTATQATVRIRSLESITIVR